MHSLLLDRSLARSNRKAFVDHSRENGHGDALRRSRHRRYDFALMSCNRSSKPGRKAKSSSPPRAVLFSILGLRSRSFSAKDFAAQLLLGAKPVFLRRSDRAAPLKPEVIGNLVDFRLVNVLMFHTFSS
jgi:hypothetical protein